MVNDEAKGWNHQYYDSYRPAKQREAYSQSSDGQPEDTNPPITPILNKRPPSTSHSPQRLNKMPTKETKDMSRTNKAPPPRSSRDVNNRNESEAQIRGFYGSSFPISHIGKYKLTERPREDETTDHSVKRRRDKGNEHDNNDAFGDKPPETASYHGREESLKDTHSEHPLPKKPVQVSFNDRFLQHLRNKPERGTSVRGGPPLTPLVSHQQFPSVQREAYVPPLGQASERKTDHDSPELTKKQDANDHFEQAPSHIEDQSVPVSARNEHLVNHGLEAMDARMRAFEEEERVKQKQHVEELAEKKRQQMQEFEHELEEKSIRRSMMPKWQGKQPSRSRKRSKRIYWSSCADDGTRGLCG